MAPISMLVAPAENGRARFIVETNGIWQDGDLGLRQDWVDIRKNIFDQFTAFLQVKRPLTQVWLRSQCRALYRSVLHEATQNILAKAVAGAGAGDPPVLNIYTYPKFDGVPWELLHDGESYLGLRYQIARMPIVSQPPAPSAETRKVDNIFHILGRGVVGLPSQDFDDWLRTFTGPNTQSFPASPGQPSWPTLDVIDKASGADILHLTCHGLPTGWTLDQQAGDPSLISGAFVDDMDLKDGKPLVFANACSPANGPPGSSPALGHRLISRGTLNVVGTFAPVTVSLAIQFARAFYGILFTPVEGRPVAIAQAMRQTKMSFHDAAAKLGANAVYDPSYLFYCLYGSANSQFELAKAANP